MFISCENHKTHLKINSLTKYYSLSLVRKLSSVNLIDNSHETRE